MQQRLQLPLVVAIIKRQHPWRAAHLPRHPAVCRGYDVAQLVDQSLGFGRRVLWDRLRTNFAAPPDAVRADEAVTLRATKTNPVTWRLR